MQFNKGTHILLHTYVHACIPQDKSNATRNPNENEPPLLSRKRFLFLRAIIIPRVLYCQYPPPKNHSNTEHLRPVNDHNFRLLYRRPVIEHPENQTDESHKALDAPPPPPCCRYIYLILSLLLCHCLPVMTYFTISIR